MGGRWGRRVCSRGAWRVTMTEGQTPLREVHGGKRPLFIYLFAPSFIHSFMYLLYPSLLCPCLLSPSVGLACAEVLGRADRATFPRAQVCATRCQGGARNL